MQYCHPQLFRGPFAIVSFITQVRKRLKTQTYFIHVCLNSPQGKGLILIIWLWGKCSRPPTPAPANEWQMRKAQMTTYCRADSRFAPSQWETVVLRNDVSHWLDASLESWVMRMVWPCFVLLLSFLNSLTPGRRGCNLKWAVFKRT